MFLDDTVGDLFGVVDEEQVEIVNADSTSGQPPPENATDASTIPIKKADQRPPDITVGAKKLRLAEACVADTTGAICLTLWEDSIHKVQAGRVYKFSPLQVRSWSEKKKVSTVEDTVISSVEDNVLSNLACEKATQKQAVIKVPTIDSVEKVET